MIGPTGTCRPFGGCTTQTSVDAAALLCRDEGRIGGMGDLMAALLTLIEAINAEVDLFA